MEHVDGPNFHNLPAHLQSITQGKTLSKEIVDETAIAAAVTCEMLDIIGGENKDVAITNMIWCPTHPLERWIRMSKSRLDFRPSWVDNELRQLLEGHPLKCPRTAVCIDLEFFYFKDNEPNVSASVEERGFPWGAPPPGNDSQSTIFCEWGGASGGGAGTGAPDM